MSAPESGVLEFYRYGSAEREVLGELRGIFEKHADRLVDGFYAHLGANPETARFLEDPETARRLRVHQRDYLLSLAGPTINEAYLADRGRIGAVHERIGIAPRWYLGAYALYLTMLTPLVLEHFAGDAQRQALALGSLQRLLLFDAHLAVDRYILQREEELERVNAELERAGARLTAELETTGAELELTAQRARAAERLADVGVLVAGLAHEIGTPMGVIQGHAKLLEPAVEGERARWRLQTIREQIDRIGRIIQSLLNMARPSRADPVPLAIAPLLENTTAFLRERLQRRDIRTHWKLEEAPLVRGDPERLQQVFLNLFLNAADAMAEGGELTISLRTVEDGAAEVRVADTGPGIPRADRSRVFTPFFTTKRAGEGNGLGLAVAQGIITEHGGRMVLADSRVGAEFQIVLPGLPKT